MNERLALHAKRIGIQDGSSRTALRDWLEEITSAKEWTWATGVQTFDMIGYLLMHTLRDAYNAASTADRADQLVARYDEPMEVGPVRYPVGTEPTGPVAKPDHS